MDKSIKAKTSNEEMQNFNSEKYKMDCPEYKMLIDIDEDPKLDIDTNKNTEITAVHKGHNLKMKNSQQLSKQCYVVQTRRSDSLFVVDDDDNSYFKEIKK